MVETISTNKISQNSLVSTTNNSIIRNYPDLPDPSSRPTLGKSILEYIQKGFDYLKNEIITKPRFSNPSLLKEDRALLERFLTLASTNCDVSQVKKEIRDRYIDLYQQSMSSYTGRENLDWLQQNFSAFEYVIDALNIFNDEEIIEIKKELFYKFLSEDDKVLLEKYKNNPSKENFNLVKDKIKDYYHQQLASVWGTPERKNIILKNLAFTNLAKMEGFPVIDILNFVDFGLKDPLETQNKEFILLNKASESYYTPEKYDDFFTLFGLFGIYEDGLKELYRLIEQDNVDLKEIKKISKILMLARTYFELCGGDPTMLDSIENNFIQNNPMNRKIERQNGVSVYLPEQLPDEIKNELSKIKIREQTTAMDLVKNNVKRIIIADKMPSDDVTKSFSGGDTAGLFIGNGIVIIKNTDNPKEMASCLIHEAEHARWSRDYKIPVDVRIASLLNEGNAYLMEGLAGNILSEKIATQIAELIGTNEFGKAKELAEKWDLSIYPTRILSYVVDDLSLRIISPVMLSLNDNEIESVKDFVDKNKDFFNLEEGTIAFSPYLISYSQFEELLKKLPSKKEEIESKTKDYFEQKEIINTVIDFLIKVIPDKTQLSEEVKSAIEKVEDPKTKQDIINMYLNIPSYADIGRMVIFILNPEFGSGLDHFRSVCDLFTVNGESIIDSREKIDSLKKDIATQNNIKIEEITDFHILSVLINEIMGN